MGKKKMGRDKRQSLREVAAGLASWPNEPHETRISSDLLAVQLGRACMQAGFESVEQIERAARLYVMDLRLLNAAETIDDGLKLLRSAIR